MNNLSQLSTIFLGVNPQDARNAISQYVRHGKWKTFVQPFCGRFGLCEAIAKTVGSAENIWASDICVFSAIVGSYLSGGDLEKLGLRWCGPLECDSVSFLFRRRTGGEDEHAASMLMVLKYAQLKHRKSYYYQSAAKELIRNADTYIAHLSGKLRELKANLTGIRFRILDYKDEIKEHMDNPDALIICDPPCYEHGYTDMFNPHGFYSWNQPDIPEFEPAEFADLMRLCQDAEATVICMQYPSHPTIPGWHTISSCCMSNRRLNRYWNLVCNRPLPPLVMREMDEPVDARYETFVNDNVRHGSKVHLIKVEENVALYYRDLLVHKLADAGGDDHFLLLIDGKVAAVIGLVFNFFTRRGLDYIYLNYAIEVSNQVEPRLHKLLTALIYSRHFKRDIIRQVSHIQNTLQFRDFVKMRSTKLSHSDHLWNMPKSAVIVKREQLKTGMWRIVYEHPFTDKTYHQCVTEYYGREHRRKPSTQEIPRGALESSDPPVSGEILLESPPSTIRKMDVGG